MTVFYTFPPGRVWMDKARGTAFGLEELEKLLR
jgi:hypothetical protein